MLPFIKSEVIIVFENIMLVIVIFSAFFLGYLFTSGVDRFFGNSGKWIKKRFKKNKTFIGSKNHPQKKEKTPEPDHFDRFFGTKIGDGRHFSVKNMENRADL